MSTIVAWWSHFENDRLKHIEYDTISIQIVKLYLKSALSNLNLAFIEYF